MDIFSRIESAITKVEGRSMEREKGEEPGADQKEENFFR